MILLVPLIYGLEECGRFQKVQDIPCNIINSFHPSETALGGDCSDFNVTIFNQTNEPVLNITWGDYIPFCNATFTPTSVGTYIYNSTLEDGIITIFQEDNMLAIVIGSGIVIMIFIGLGIINKGLKLKLFSYGLAMIETIIMVSLLYAREINIDIGDIMRLNFYIMLFLGFGVGMISLSFHSFAMVNQEEKQDSREQDSFHSDKW